MYDREPARSNGPHALENRGTCLGITTIGAEPHLGIILETKRHMPRIVALFACSVVCVAFSLPASAEDTAGVIEAIDVLHGSLRLADGSIYALPGGLDCSAMRPGMEVHLLFTRENAGSPQIHS